MSNSMSAMWFFIIQKLDHPDLTRKVARVSGTKSRSKGSVPHG